MALHRFLMRAFGLLMCLTLFIPASATPQTGPDPFASVSWMIGNWKGRGKAFGLGNGEERPFTSRLTVNRILGGKWLEFKVAVTPEGASEPVAEGLDYWSAGPKPDRFREVTLDSNGDDGVGIVTVESSTVVRETGSGSGDPRERFYRVTFTRISEREFTIRYEVSPDKKRWRNRTLETHSRAD